MVETSSNPIIGADIGSERAGNRLKVLFVEYGVGFGGAVVSLSELVKGFQKLGNVEPVVITFHKSETIVGLFHENFELINLRPLLSYHTKYKYQGWVNRWFKNKIISRLFMRIYVVLDYLYQFYLSCRLFLLAKSCGIHIVHINNGYQPSSVRAARWLKKPCIIHARGFGFDRIAENIRDHYHKNNPVYGVVAISNSVKKAAVSQGLPQNKVATIYNPLDLELFKVAQQSRQAIRKKYDLKERAIVFGIFGRVTPWKGQLEFVEAVNKVIRGCPNMHVWVIGDPSDAADSSYYNRLQALCDSELLKNRVNLVGYQNSAQDYYAAVDVVVHNSIEPEPFGRVIIEGMASNNAVIAMNEGGPTELIQHLEDGYLVEPRNTEKLSEAIELLYCDKELREKLANKALQKVSVQFSNEVIAKEVFKFYKDCGALQ